MMTPEHTITTADELEQLQGTPGRVAQHKVIHHLDQHCLQFIEHSPFAVISTSNKNGCCDTSPRGDAPGFAMILNNTTLILPERTGNRRMDSLRNLLENPHIGVLFMIPGVEETLRINGKASITKSPSVLEKLEAKGHVPNLAIVITVEECFIHCAKAFKRSHLWNPEQWPSIDKLPAPAKMIAAHTKLDDVDEASIQASLTESYTKRLY